MPYFHFHKESQHGTDFSVLVQHWASDSSQPIFTPVFFRSCCPASFGVLLMRSTLGRKIWYLSGKKRACLKKHSFLTLCALSNLGVCCVVEFGADHSFGRGGPVSRTEELSVGVVVGGWRFCELCLNLGIVVDFRRTVEIRCGPRVHLWINCSAYPNLGQII